MTGVKCDAGGAYPSETPEITQRFVGFRAAPSYVFYVGLLVLWVVCLSGFFRHSVVSLPSIYEFYSSLYIFASL